MMIIIIIIDLFLLKLSSKVCYINMYITSGLRLANGKFEKASADFHNAGNTEHN